MPIEIKNLFDEPNRSEYVGNQGGGGSDLGKEEPKEAVRVETNENELPFVFFENEENEYVKFLINKFKCVEVTNDVAWVSRRSIQRSSFYSKKT